MTATMTWTIPTCEHEIATGGITVVHWRCVAEEADGDTTYTASSYGTVGLTPDASAPDFVPYDQVTEETALGWVWDALDKDVTEAALADNIAAQKNPTAAAGLPWV